MAHRNLLAALLCSASAHALDTSRLPKLQEKKPPPRAPPPKPSVLREVRPLSRADIVQVFGHAGKLYNLQTVLQPASPFELSLDSPSVAGKGRIVGLYDLSSITYGPAGAHFRPHVDGNTRFASSAIFEIDVTADHVYLFDCRVEPGKYSAFVIGAYAATGQTINGPDIARHFVVPAFATQGGRLLVYLGSADEKASWAWGGCTVTPSK